MIVTLKDGSKKEYAEAKSVIDIAYDISEGLARAACAGEVNGEVVDLRTVIDSDCELNILTAKDEKGLAVLRHTASHVLAQAVQTLFPDAKVAIGPSIDTGFYYDFDPLAGPVVACAVILPQDSRILYLNDSKKLSASKREELYDVIMREAVSVGIGMRSPERIDEINILQATYEAMREAVSKLEVVPQLLLNDAVTIPQITIPQVPIIKGDAKSVSIAAASIVAKVTRDRMMEKYDKVFPEYGFASNKGYGSADHIAALKKYGETPIHRKTFITHFI